MASQANARCQIGLCGRVMMMFAPAILVFLTFCMAFAAKAAEGPPFTGEWQSQHFRDHPLVGKVFDGRGTVSDWASLLAAMERIDVVVAGETHTNADHHSIQAELARGMAGRLFATVFEMVPQRLQPVLDEATDGSLALDALDTALEWEKRGWGSFSAYQPIFAASRSVGARLIAGNPDEDMTRSLARGGLDALPKTVSLKTGLALPVDDAIQTGLIKAMADSHCNMLPENLLPNMALVQRLRDGTMASVTKQSLLDGKDSSMALIITGNGHARKDRGVPAVLSALKTGLFTLSIGLIEVSDGDDAFADYGLTGADGEPLYDFVVFTPRDNLDDPCELMREQMKARTKTKP